ncbi:MAG: hypothetical protein WD119_01395, partial [Pirellulaceae bacterium]
MFANLVRYTTALLVLGGLAIGYELTIVPILEPPPIEAVPIEPAAMLTRATMVDGLFPEGSWQRNAPRRLKTEAGFLLFSYREQISTERWRVWPVTVIIGDAENPPVVMDAPDGAEITFAEPLDVLSRGAPPIESGQLRGNVSIRTMSQVDGKPLPVAEQLEILATDVGIDRRRIWTHQSIRLRLGEIVLAGRNLTLQLAGGGGIPTSGKGSPLSMLDNLQLVYLDELSIPLPGNGLFSGRDDNPGTANATSSNAASETAASNSRVTVQCDGTVSFDFATDTLELHNQVRLEHHSAGQPSDSVECQSLRVKFNNPLASDLPRETPSDWIRRIEATGEPVLAKLPSIASEAVAERISYDAEQMRFRMDGPEGVSLRYRGTDLKTNEFVYTLDADDPKKLGTLQAVGNGIMSFHDTAPSALRRVRWSKGVRLQPADSRDQHELWVNGDVHAETVEEGSMRADALVFRFRQEDRSDRSTETPRKPLLPFGDITPTTALATGNVKVDTSGLFSETNELQLFFDIKPKPDELQEDQLALNPAEGEPLRFWVRQPSESGKEDSPGRSPVARPRPKLFGDKVRAKVTIVDQQVSGGDLSVDGAVRLEHEMITDQGALPVSVTGHQLRVIHDDGKELIHIVGDEKPARFDLGDGFFIGPAIEINLKDNYVWINDKGSFRMPSVVLPSGDQQATVRWAAAPQCDWSGEMLFDGREIELSGGVRLTAEMNVGEEDTPWNVAATGDRLKIRLDKEIDIGKPEQARTTSIRDIALLGDKEHPVYLTADETDGDDRLVTRHVLSTPVMSILPSMGGLVAEGPGWYRQWTVSTGQGAMEKFAPAGSLIGMHLIFEEEMV